MVGAYTKALGKKRWIGRETWQKNRLGATFWMEEVREKSKSKK